jgi:hypothetical protein
MTKLSTAPVKPTNPSSVVAKVPNRKGAYSNDDKSFEIPPYIKNERSAQLECKVKSIAIKKINKRKHKKIFANKQKKKTKKGTNEDNKLEKNCIKKHKWVKAMSKRLRLEHEERLALL